MNNFLGFTKIQWLGLLGFVLYAAIAKMPVMQVPNYSDVNFLVWLVIQSVVMVAVVKQMK